MTQQLFYVFIIHKHTREIHTHAHPELRYYKPHPFIYHSTTRWNITTCPVWMCTSVVYGQNPINFNQKMIYLKAKFDLWKSVNFIYLLFFLVKAFNFYFTQKVQKKEKKKKWKVKYSQEKFISNVTWLFSVKGIIKCGTYIHFCIDITKT